jgi:hypothetical protein
VRAFNERDAVASDFCRQFKFCKWLMMLHSPFFSTTTTTMLDEDEELQEDFFSSQSESVKLEPKQSLFFGDDEDEEEDEKPQKNGVKVEAALQVSAAPSVKRTSDAEDIKPVKRPRKQSEDDIVPYFPSTHSRQETQWDRRFVGTFIVQAWSLSKGSNYVQQGDKIFVQRQKPKVANQSMSNGKSAKGNAAVKSKQTRLVFNTTAATPKKAKVKEDIVVRFSNSRGEWMNLSCWYNLTADHTFVQASKWAESMLMYRSGSPNAWTRK